MEFKKFMLKVYQKAETESNPEELSEIANLVNESEKSGNLTFIRKKGINDKLRSKCLFTQTCKFPKVLKQANIYLGIAGNIHALKKRKITKEEFEKQKKSYINELSTIGITALNDEITLTKVEGLSEKSIWW